MKKTIGLSPLSLPDNEFIQKFTGAVRGSGCNVVNTTWRLRDFATSDIIIFHWPTPMFDVKFRRHARRNLLKMRIARLFFRTKFVWVVHNLIPHNVSSASDTGRRFIQSLDGLIYLSKASVAQLEAEYGPSKKARKLVTVHGAYEPVTPTLQPRTLAIHDRVDVAYIGQVKPYKNLERLIQAATDLESVGAKLTITGKISDAAYAQDIRSLSKDFEVDVDLRDDLIEIDELERLVDDSDCIVLPYSRVLNSGSALFCLSRCRPIIVPNMGALPELAADVGPGWIYLYDGEMTGETLTTAVAWLRHTDRASTPNLSRYDWQKVGDEISAFLKQL